MIFADIDGVCIDFYGTAKKHFGIEMELNEFGIWKWGRDGYPSAEEFYAAAKPHEWYPQLMLELVLGSAPSLPAFITADYAELKKKVLFPLRNCDCCDDYKYYKFIEEPDKAKRCRYPNDVLIDDCLANCEAWRKKGGVAFHFDLAKPFIFEKFLDWWRL